MTKIILFEKKPWLTVKNEPEKCKNTLFNCVHIIVNLAVILEPFLPFSSGAVIDWFHLNREWKLQYADIGFKFPPIYALFKRLDKSIIEKELYKLNAKKQQNT